MRAPDVGTTPAATAYLRRLRVALDRLEPDLDRIAEWGERLGQGLSAGGRLLTAGNGGSAAHAEHLASEFVGRYHEDRRPYSALALHSDGSALTALVNDYGPADMFARQVEAHARPGDFLIMFSTSGRSPNVLEAARAARRCQAVAWALTGPAPNPLAEEADAAFCVTAERTATVQEVHQVLIHLLCAAFDEAVGGT